MHRVIVVLISCAYLASANDRAANCENYNGSDKWQFPAIEKYHEDVGLYLTLDCNVVGKAISHGSDERGISGRPVDEGEYCRYTSARNANSGRLTENDVEELLAQMPKESMKLSVAKFGETTYGCSASSETPSTGNEKQSITCLYKKRVQSQTCI